MQRILVLCTRRIGDVLLATPLIRSVRRAWPQARVEVLVNRRSAVALHGNPDVDAVLCLDEPSPAGQTLALAGRIARRYDLAVCTLPSDRPQLLAFAAAPRRAAIVPEEGARGARWKRALAQSWTPVATRITHAAIQYLRLADVLGIPRHWDPVAPRPLPAEAPPSALAAMQDAAQPYAVLHPVPMFRYKAWTVEGWAMLAQALAARGLRVAFTGGPDAAEREQVARIVEASALGARAVDLAGQLPFAALTPLIEGARVFVGPDTSVTHLAAATGTPTVAVFGPSLPVTWGPWPVGFREDLPSPWTKRAPLQQRGNVWLLQGISDCVPCQLEGCERHLQSRADCLDGLPAPRVIAAAEAALAARIGP